MTEKGVYILIMKYTTGMILCCFLLTATLTGETLKHASPPAPRIVSLAPALTELVCFLGYGKALVGRSEVCNYPSFVKKLPVTGSFGNPEGERILALRPTLVLANDLAKPAILNPFRKAKVRVLFKQCRNLEDYCAWVALLGRELNCTGKAEAELKRIDSFRKECRALNQKTARKKRVLWVIWDSPLMVAGKGSLPHTVLTLAGGINCAGEVGQEYFKASYEWVLSNPPEVIVWTASGKRVRTLKNHPFWKQLEAVKKGRVIHTLDSDTLQRPGPRLTEGVRLLRKALEKI